MLYSTRGTVRFTDIPERTIFRSQGGFTYVKNGPSTARMWDKRFVGTYNYHFSSEHFVTPLEDEKVEEPEIRQPVCPKARPTPNE